MKRLGTFFWVVAIFALVLVFFDGVFPSFAKAVAGSAQLLPVPRTLKLWYLILIGGALCIYVISSQATVEDFLRPIRQAASKDAEFPQRAVFCAVVGLLPVAVGSLTVLGFVPKAELPSGTRQQHPGMSSGSAVPYAGKENPFRKPAAADLASFRERYASLPGPEDEFDSRPKKQEPPPEDPKALAELFSAQALYEGRSLYFKNCLPCHGPKLDGDGTASVAWSLKPINFTDPGTIATLVEDSVLWRVAEGGLGLPPVATPWDSAMPRWKVDLTEEEIWKIVIAEYHDAAVKPRVLEFRLEGHGAEGGK